ncbi:hypothetical protein SUGI_1071510 [Cryptomeria japonica]|nr:hypothetical protein SUGI_1071510 [Cryptomeria japonica]
MALSKDEYWILLYNLPMEFWTRDCLEKIDAKLGIVLGLDMSEADRASYIRMKLISIKPLPSMLHLDSNNYHWDQPVEVEMQKFFCLNCDSRAHFERCCSQRKDVLNSKKEDLPLPHPRREPRTVSSREAEGAQLDLVDVSPTNNTSHPASEGGEEATRIEGACVGEADLRSTKRRALYATMQRADLRSEVDRFPSPKVSPTKKDNQSHNPILEAKEIMIAEKPGIQPGLEAVEQIAEGNVFSETQEQSNLYVVNFEGQHQLDNYVPLKLDEQRVEYHTGKSTSDVKMPIELPVLEEEADSNREEVGLTEPRHIFQSAHQSLEGGSSRKIGRKTNRQRREEVVRDQGLPSIKEYLLRSKGSVASLGE